MKTSLIKELMYGLFLPILSIVLLGFSIWALHYSVSIGANSLPLWVKFFTISGGIFLSFIVVYTLFIHYPCCLKSLGEQNG